jgi:hypothetical protein
MIYVNTGRLAGSEGTYRVTRTVGDEDEEEDAFVPIQSKLEEIQCYELYVSSIVSVCSSLTINRSTG